MKSWLLLIFSVCLRNLSFIIQLRQEMFNKVIDLVDRKMMAASLK